MSVQNLRLPGRASPVTGTIQPSIYNYWGLDGIRSVHFYSLGGPLEAGKGLLTLSRSKYTAEAPYVHLGSLQRVEPHDIYLAKLLKLNAHEATPARDALVLSTPHTSDTLTLGFNGSWSSADPIFLHGGTSLFVKEAIKPVPVHEILFLGIALQFFE